MSEAEKDESSRMPSWREAVLYFLFLGFVSVGGPVAQITMMFIAGLLNLLVDRGWPRIKARPSTLAAVAVLIPFLDSRVVQIAWLFFKTGLFSFGDAYGGRASSYF